jgi:pimeloyl-ACP methyl ester carboxylesterase
MGRFLKVVGGLVGLIVLLVLAAFVWRTLAQRHNVELARIDSPNGIQESRFVRINGIDQYIEIRGQNRANPVLLMLHGGPGSPLSPVTYKMFLPLEKAFTVVNWDQRGAGRTYGRNGEAEAEASTMTVPIMATDTIELAQYLKTHLHKQKIGVVAASGGSTLGLMAVKQRPDLFYAYVGTGQLISVRDAIRVSYDYALDRAKATKDAKAVGELNGIGAPPWRDPGAEHTHQKWLGVYAPPSEKTFVDNANIIPLILTAPNYSWADFQTMLKGGAFTSRTLLPTFNQFDIKALGFDYGLPLFFFQGSDDHRTPTLLVQAFLDKVSAPHKELVLLPGGGHTAALALPDLFIKSLIERVRPFGVAAEAPPAASRPASGAVNSDDERRPAR